MVEMNCVSIGDGQPRKTSKWAEYEMIGGTQTTNYTLASESDFISVDTAGVRGPRKPDGNLPDLTFMHIAAGNSKLIDAGTNVEGIKYIGAATDLGCFEVGMSNDTVLAVIEKPIAVSTFTLHQNYPNPFNPATQITFSVAARSQVTLKVYDVLGKEVATLFNGVAESGRQYTAQFNAKNLTSGMYFSVLQNGSQRITKKMLLVK